VKRFLIGCLFFVVIVPGLWIVAVPESLLVNLVEGATKDGDIRIEAADVDKGLFFNFTFGSILLRDNDKTLLVLKNVEGKINPLSLLVLRLDLIFSGDVSGGKMTGKIDLFRGKRNAAITIYGADVGEVPFFALLGIEGRGALSGEMKLKETTGDIKFLIREARFSPGKFGGVTVPLDVFSTARGALSVAGKTVRITSFALEGDGIYARLSGDITGGRMNLTLELMPEKSFKDRNFIFIALEKYKASPGHYSIPINDVLPL